METKTLQVVKVEFRQGGMALETGIKEDYRTRGVVIGGGNGTYITVIPNKLLVHGMDSGGREFQIHVLRALRNGMDLKRLLKPHRDALIYFHPKEVHIVLKPNGFWCLHPASIEEWLSRACTNSDYRACEHQPGED